MENNFFLKPPIKNENGIPVFSQFDNYIENYEKISNDHLEHFNKTGDNPFMDESYWREIEDSTRLLIKKYAKPNQKILDVGVGMGRLLEEFTELDRYGMDISSGYLQIAKTKGIDCCMSLIEDMPYKDNSFDIVTCTDVLEHVLDLNLGIKNILRVLKPDGILIVRVPYKEDLSWYLGPECPYEFVHLRTFDEQHLQAMFTKIFKTEVLEWNTSGFLKDLTRLKYPVMPYNRLINRLSSFYYDHKLKDKKSYELFLNGNVINYVVKNKK